MKKTLIAFSIFLGGFYYYSGAHTTHSKFVFSGQEFPMPDDTNKNAAANTGNTGGADDHTQQVMDSLNNPQGVYYGNFGNNDQPVHVEGMREPNSYKSGRTGGQYDAVVKPGVTPMKKKSDDESGK